MQATENRNQFASAEMLAAAKATVEGLIEVVADIERFRGEESRKGQDGSLGRATGRSAPHPEKGAGLAIGIAFALGCLSPILSKTICLGFGPTLKILVVSVGLASLILAR